MVTGILSPADDIKDLEYDVTHFDGLDSTNEHLKRLAMHKSAIEGTVIAANEQSDGRGRSGNKWISAKGNLYFSLLLRPNVPIRDLANISFLTAIAIGNVLERLLPSENILKYKWPNDILIDNKKVAGILLESSLSASKNKADWLIIGVGVNTSSAPDYVIDNVTSLTDVGVDSITERKLLEAILKQFNGIYTRWLEEGFSNLRSEWLSRAAFLNELITVRTANHEYRGLFRDINKNGELVLELPDGKLRLISTGEVFFAAVAA